MDLGPPRRSFVPRANVDRTLFAAMPRSLSGVYCTGCSMSMLEALRLERQAPYFPEEYGMVTLDRERLLANPADKALGKSSVNIDYKPHRNSAFQAYFSMTACYQASCQLPCQS